MNPLSALPYIRDHFGFKRRLGYLPPTPEMKKLRASRTNISAITPLIPMSEWKEVDYVTGSPKSLILDQLQEGACVGGSCAGGWSRQHWLRTGKVITPSLWFIYDQINGGRDNGAFIIDALTTMLNVGAPPVSLYGKSLWKPGLIPPGAPMYKEDVAITVTNSVDCATALISLAGLPQIPVNVTSAFGIFDKDGVAWNGVAPHGPNSNHSVYLGGLKNIRGRWLFRMVNDWNLWGPFGDGTCYIPVEAVDNPAVQDDGWLHLSTFDPDDTPPVPVSEGATEHFSIAHL